MMKIVGDGKWEFAFRRSAGLPFTRWKRRRQCFDFGFLSLTEEARVMNHTTINFSLFRVKIVGDGKWGFAFRRSAGLPFTRWKRR